MRVNVDSERCQGHARCYAICPEVFELDDIGFAVSGDREVDPIFEQKVIEAEASCPESAILVEP